MLVLGETGKSKESGSDGTGQAVTHALSVDDIKDVSNI
jgi:hypothetical protein